MGIKKKTRRKIGGGKTKKKVRRKIAKKDWRETARWATCAFCGEHKPIICVVFSEDWGVDEEGEDQCRDCLAAQFGRIRRAKVVMAEAKDRLGHKLTHEKAERLHAKLIEDEDTLKAWEIKLNLEEE